MLCYATKQVAKCGDIVYQGSKRYMIIRVGVEISNDLTFAHRTESGITGDMISQYHYVGKRLKVNNEPRKGPGFRLDEFTTTSRERYERIPDGFNHMGLLFEIERKE